MPERIGVDRDTPGEQDLYGARADTDDFPFHFSLDSLREFRQSKEPARSRPPAGAGIGAPWRIAGHARTGKLWIRRRASGGALMDPPALTCWPRNGSASHATRGDPVRRAFPTVAPCDQQTSGE